MVVHQSVAHTHGARGDAKMAKHIKFPPDVEDFIHELIIKALQRKALKEKGESCRA